MPPKLKGWVYVLFLAYFMALSGTLLFKRHFVLNDWPFDDAYFAQQYHNWKSGYPVVTVRPRDNRAGFVGERPFEEPHLRLLDHAYKIVYWFCPRTEALILLYALFVSLSVVTLAFLLTELRFASIEIFWLLLCWMLYPLQQQMAMYTFRDQICATGTFYFLYLTLLLRGSKYAVLGAFALFFARGESVLLLLPTVLILPKMWRTLLLHFACTAPVMWLTKSGGGDPFAYARRHFTQLFLMNFPLTQSVHWALAFINPAGLILAAAFMGSIMLVGGEIYFRFPWEFVGAGFRKPGSYYYYAPYMALMMAALAVGLSRIESGRRWRVLMCAFFMIGPGLAFSAYQFRTYWNVPKDDIRAVRALMKEHVAPNAAVVTDHALSALFAERDELYVYRQPPPGKDVAEVFRRSTVAVIQRRDVVEMESGYLSESSARPWHMLAETVEYRFYGRR
ncbi:MAG: hypothetical protein ABL955_01990 [Elusimicrobiota bacterium]